MIELETLSKAKGSNKYGACINCGMYEDKSRLSRITIINNNQGTSIILCDDCAIKMRDLLNYIEICKLCEVE